METSLPESISDEECSICLSVLIKPVTLACKHELCMCCLEQVLQQFATCPICTRKFGSEFTPSTDLSLHVNQKRWEEIQSRYPERVRRRTNDLDTDEEEDNFEFALSLSKLHFEQEQKLVNVDLPKSVDNEESEVEPAGAKAEKKGTKRKPKDKAAKTTTKTKVVKPPAKAVKSPAQPTTSTRVLRSRGKVSANATATDTELNETRKKRS